MIIKPGNDTIQNLIKEINNGFLITKIVGNGVNNLQNGDFIFQVKEGFLIKNSEIYGLIDKSVSFTGNIFKILGDSDILFSSELFYVDNGIYSPAIFTESLTLL